MTYAPILYVENAFYIIGGWICDGYSNVIARLDNDNQWSKAGVLKQARNAHGAIYDGNQIMVIGGGGNFQTEKCEIQNETVSCISQEPTLNKYAWYPELYLVSDTYCKN